MDLRGPFSFFLSSLLSPFLQQSGRPKERRPSGKSSVGLLALIAFRWQYFKKRTSLVPASLVPCIVNLTHIHLGTPERPYSVYARRNRSEREREIESEKTYQQCGNGRPCCPGDELFLCSACSGFVAIIRRRGRHSSLKEEEEEEEMFLSGNSMDFPRIR